MPDKLILTKEERRARREARREKQRAQNLIRAHEMHLVRKKFEQEPQQPALIRKNTKAKKILFHTGCSGWFYWHWRDNFYLDVANKDWFKHYAGQFKTVELNAPFYSWPAVKTVNSWIKQAADEKFVYTVKVCELITHIRRFKGTKQLIKDFGFIADLLGSQLGCFLFQLPPSYHYKPGRLKDILSQLDHTRRNVVEFRHPSWWNEDVFTAFRETGTIFCSCSGPRLPDQLVKTAADIYIRFHGLTRWYRHDYTKQELKLWADRVKESGANQVWAYFNNDFNGYAISNARAFSKLLERNVKVNNGKKSL